MLTKTLKFDNDVLEVVRAMEWNETGTLGKLIGQLDRKLYEKVNKAIEAMGGKWNRSAKAHVFKSDPRPQVEGLLTNGALTVERDGFFETPEAVVLQMLDLVPLPDFRCRVLEPEAGRGAILRVLLAHDAHHIYYAIEKNEQRTTELREDFPSVNVACGDFLQCRFHFDRIYMNPPFEEMQDVDHVRHAYDLLLGDGALVSVMSESPFFRTDRKATAFREWLDEVGGYSVELPEGAFKESGTGVRARLVVIRK
jgi:hypothetical protein